MSEREETDYDRYLSTRTLLSLQKPAEARTHQDELLFQVVHQVEELWMKLVLDEVHAAIRALGADEHATVVGHMSRATEVQRLMVSQLRLMETLTPHAYLSIRKGLGQGSGQESPGFNAILRIAPKLGEALHASLERAGIDAEKVHREPEAHPLAMQVVESVMDFDIQMQSFRYAHLMIVKRTIGGLTPSLKGKPVDLLEKSMRKAFYPELWEIRERLFTDFIAGPSLKTGS